MPKKIEATVDIFDRRLLDKKLEPLLNPPTLPSLTDLMSPAAEWAQEDSSQHNDSQIMEDGASISSGSPSSMSTSSSLRLAQPQRPARPTSMRRDSKTRTVSKLRHKHFRVADELKKEGKHQDQDKEKERLMIPRPSAGKTNSARPTTAMAVIHSGNQASPHRESRIVSAVCDRVASARPSSRSSVRASTTPQIPRSRRSQSRSNTTNPDKSMFWRPHRERAEEDREDDSCSPSNGRTGPRLPFVEFSLDGKLGSAPEMDVRIDSLLECCWMAGVRHRSRPSVESVLLAESEIYFGERIVVRECVDGWIRDSIGWLPLHFKSDPVFRIVQATGEESWRLPSHMPAPPTLSTDIQLDLSWILEDSFPESPSSPPGSLYLSGL